MAAGGCGGLRGGRGIAIATGPFVVPDVEDCAYLILSQSLLLSNGKSGEEENLPVCGGGSVLKVAGST